MAIISYFRSSSYNNWQFCQLQWYITYVLGWQGPNGKKAEKGTITHKVLECLAVIKKRLQEKPKAKQITDPQLGVIKFSKDFLLPYHLTDTEVDAVNHSRRSKNIYVTPMLIKSGHIRYGVALVEELLEKAYDYYKAQSIHKWTAADKRDCLNFCWMAVDHQKGMFDPRKRNVQDAEPHFDFELPYDWAKYDYGDNKGSLHIKGTIDLVTRIDDDTLEIIDWKTGSRVDWSSNKTPLPIKTYAKLCKDPQLMLYYWAARHMYPDVKNIILSIFFTRDGGPFSICFDDNTIVEMEGLLKQRFEEIKKSQNPKMLSKTQKSFKCKYICNFYKMKLDEEDDDNLCMKVHKLIDKRGMDYVTKNHSNPDFTFGTYDAPGE